jgi:protein-S-isoprenylcysteine O-methyltransferase Ste14
MNFILAVFLWLLFGFLHSMLARPYFKNLIKLFIGEKFEKRFYRLFYFITQCMFFYFIWGIIKNLDGGNILFVLPKKYEFLYYVFNILSNLFLIICILNFDISEFIGLSQLFNLKKSKVLNTKSFYKYIRHPMYLGIVLVYISSSTIFNEMFFINLLCIICYIEVGSFYEEKTLLITFKTKYKNYQLKTYKYLPFIR